MACSATVYSKKSKSDTKPLKVLTLKGRGVCKATTASL